MELFLDPQSWLALITLTALEIALGIDNLIFVSLLVERVPKARQRTVRALGLSLAMLMRVALLMSISWLMGMQATLFSALGHAFSVRDLILSVGGIFLLVKSTLEIHGSVESETTQPEFTSTKFGSIVLQIVVVDLVFSVDSIITAIGMAQQVQIMIAAVIVSMFIMMGTSAYIGALLEKHPTLKMLALSFLLLIGMALVAEGFGMHIPKGYLYFAMAFSVFVEVMNIRLRQQK
jgi:predicted tellurium resistance membrane protein TerC